MSKAEARGANNPRTAKLEPRLPHAPDHQTHLRTDIGTIMKGQISLPLMADPDATAPADKTADTVAETARCATSEHLRTPAWLTELREREIALWQAAVDAAAGFNTQGLSDRAVCVQADARTWLDLIPDNSIHAVVTDPPSH